MTALLRTVCLAVMLLLGACAGRPKPEDPSITAMRQTIMLESLGQIGRPYRWGGTTPAGFDCSGLVQYAYGQAGVAVPRTTREQYAAGERIDLDEARAGDLLFYRFSGWRGVDHVAIYLGDGRAVHAPSSGRTVIVARVDDAAWMKHFRGAVRLLKP